MRAPRKTMAVLGCLLLGMPWFTLGFQASPVWAVETKGLFDKLNPNKSGTLEEPFIWEDYLAWRDQNKLFLLNLRTKKQMQLNDSTHNLLEHNLVNGMVFWQQQESQGKVVYVYDIKRQIKRPLDLPNPWGTRVSPEGLLYWVIINDNGAREIVWYDLATGKEDRHQLPLSIPSVATFSAGARYIAWSAPMGDQGYEVYAYDKLNKQYSQFGTVSDETYPLVDGSFLVYIKADGEKSTLEAVDLEQEVNWTIGNIGITDPVDASNGGQSGLPQVSNGNVVWVEQSPTGQQQIFNHNLPTAQTSQVTHNSTSKSDIAFQDGKLVWVEKSQSADGKVQVSIQGVDIIAPKEQFYDILGHWAEGDIRSLIKQGKISGLKDANNNVIFAPNRSITRAEFVTLLQRVLAPTTPSTSNTNQEFRDSTNHWARESILAAVQRGYIKGYTDNTFRPNAPITRAEIASIISRLVTFDQLEGASLDYLDVPAQHWASTSIATVTKGGIMQGYAKGEFKPAGVATRAEIVTVLKRLTDKGLL